MFDSEVEVSGGVGFWKIVFEPTAGKGHQIVAFCGDGAFKRNGYPPRSGSAGQLEGPSI